MLVPSLSFYTSKHSHWWSINTIKLVTTILLSVYDNRIADSISWFPVCLTVAYAVRVRLMPDWFFSFGGMNYARYLTFFECHLINIEHSHPSAKDLLRNRAFSVARSFTPGNRLAVDKTMEETFMKHAKSRGGASAGLIGITQNHEAYQRWVRTSHERVKYVERTLEIAEMYHS